MRTPPPGRRSIKIGRLDLDLRGIAPDTAEAAARALGAALARALNEGTGDGSRLRPAERIDAGRIQSPASADGHDLAARIARRIAHAVEREEP